MTLISANFPYEQDQYTPWRRFMRDFLLQTLAFHLLVPVETRNMHYIPPEGPTMLMMNHIGALDPIVMMGAVEPRFVVPMSKIENFRIPLIGFLMRKWGAYPIRRGEVDRSALQNTIDLLKAGNLVLMAPEGHRQPVMHEGKDGATFVAIKSNAAVVPVGLEGTRDFVSNLKRLRRTHVTLTFGPAFRFRVSGNERVPRAAMSRMTQEAMYQLAMLVSEKRRGFYSDLSKVTTETLEFLT